MNISFIKSFTMLCSFNKIDPGMNRPISIVRFPLESPGRDSDKNLAKSMALIQLYLSNFYDVEPCDLSHLILTKMTSQHPLETDLDCCQSSTFLKQRPGVIKDGRKGSLAPGFQAGAIVQQDSFPKSKPRCGRRIETRKKRGLTQLLRLKAGEANDGQEEESVKTDLAARKPRTWQ